MIFIRVHLRSLLIAVFFLALTCSKPASAQDAPQPSLAQRAVTAIINQVVIDTSVHVQKTNAALSTTGSWSIAQDPPSSCPPSTQCATVFYKVPDDGVTCQWSVALGDGPEGTILDQNDDASLYMVRKLTLLQAHPLVASRREPIYPNIAMAAHVGGIVGIKVTVSTSGTVEKVIGISGPDMLKGAALDALKGWKFQPLVVGTKPIRFQTSILFAFVTKGFPDGKVTSEP